MLTDLDSKSKKVVAEVPGTVVTLGDLIHHVDTEYIKRKRDMFMMGRDETTKLRPGILVLINEADWELEGTVDYKLADGDCVAFISMLHGG